MDFTGEPDRRDGDPSLALGKKCFYLNLVRKVSTFSQISSP